MTNTPVAFLIFNRPDCTRQTFAAIREMRPTHLLVVADGPRANKPDEALRCAEARAVIEEGVDWPCQVEREYAAENLGCRNRVSSGLDWVFSRVEEAIILEDDCLPHPSFFPFCEELLTRYRHDTRILTIAGANLSPGADENAPSYRFSNICHVWGWASWRRAWNLYDVNMPTWPRFRDEHRITEVFSDPEMANHWEKELERVYRREIDTWDYQLNFAGFSQSCVSIVPRTNLVTNIGFSGTATHTTDSSHPNAGLAAAPIGFPLDHPPFVLADAAADKNAIRPPSTRRWKRLITRILAKARTIVPANPAT